LELPWLGLGLSANLDARALPNPWQLHARFPDLFDFVEYSAPLSLAEARAQAPRMQELEANRATLPVLFHPVHLNLHGPQLELARNLQALDAQARALGSPWVGNDVGWWHHQGSAFPGYLYIPPSLDAQGLDDAVAHALHVQSALSVPLALENPAVVARRGSMHVLAFMAELHARTGCPLILDLGHLLAFQLTAGLPVDAALSELPLEAVIEIHLAGGVVSARGERRFYVDDHTQPVREELFGLLEQVLPHCKRLRAVCFEGDGHPPEIALGTLRRLRALVPAFARDPLTLEPRPSKEKHTLSSEARSWKIFEALYGEREVHEDPEGHAAETDHRLAVLAESLDRAFPLTRLLTAGSRAQLLAFGRSPELRNFFDGTGRELAQCFAAFARRRVREKPDAGVEAALAFESWLLAQSSLPADPQLARGVRVASFPSDLSELVFAARAVKRNLAGRAWGSERWDTAALESVAQAARRPGAGPWWIAIRRSPEGIETVNLDAELLGVLRAASAGATLAELLAEPRHAEGAARAQRLGLLTSSGSPGSPQAAP